MELGQYAVLFCSRKRSLRYNVYDIIEIVDKVVETAPVVKGHIQAADIMPIQVL